MSTRGSKQAKAAMPDRQSRESWLQAALQALAKGGIDQVRVEWLARDLGVTKGSFYWHFKDRDQFLEALLDYWAEQSTQTVIRNRSYPDDPPARIRAVAEDIVRRDLAGMDPHIRSWTQYDPRRAKVVASVDKLRFGFLRDLFVAAGYPADEAALRAQCLYRYALGEQFILARESKAQRLRRMHTQIDLLLGP